MEALRRCAPVPITFEAMAADTDGYFSADHQKIAIRQGDVYKRQVLCLPVRLYVQRSGGNGHLCRAALHDVLPHAGRMV